MKNLLHVFFQKNRHFGRKHIFDHFIQLGAPETSLHRWLNLLFNKKTLNRKAGSGRKPKIAIPENTRRTRIYFNDRCGRSQKKFATRLKTSQQYISFILKKYTKIRCSKKIGDHL